MILIFYSILPRFDRFQAPGPELHKDKHPRFFWLIKDLSDHLGQKMPSKVFLINEMNAWVANRGGIFGIGSKRIMALGLPLLSLLNTSQLKSVLTHEMGHFVGKDTTLSPIIYRSRYALTQTIHQLDKRVSFFTAPFRYYYKIFLKLSESISRSQELVADTLAGQVAGSLNAIQALEKIFSAENSYQIYWNKEVVPLLESGYLVPIADGFEQYSKSGPISEQISKDLEDAKRKQHAEIYDSHPALAERISLLRGLNIDNVDENDEMATNLFNDFREIELDLIRFNYDNAFAARLKALSWEDVPKSALLPAWKDIADQCKVVLLGIKPIDLYKFSSHEYRQDFYYFHLGNPENPFIDMNNPYEATRVSIGAAFAVQLYNNGWHINYKIGESVSFKLNTITIEPFEILWYFMTEYITKDAWRNICNEAGLDKIDLGKL